LRSTVAFLWSSTSATGRVTLYTTHTFIERPYNVRYRQTTTVSSKSVTWLARDIAAAAAASVLIVAMTTASLDDSVCRIISFSSSYELQLDIVQHKSFFNSCSSGLTSSVCPSSSLYVYFSHIAVFHYSSVFLRSFCVMFPVNFLYLTLLLLLH